MGIKNASRKQIMPNKELTNEYISLKKQIFDKYYSYLNERQRESVFYINGPLLVLAGAGTGKTKVLVERISYMLRYGNAYHSTYVPADLDEEKIEELKKTLSSDSISEFDLDQFATKQPYPSSILSITFTNKAANEMKERLRVKVGDEAINQIWAGTFHSMCLRILRKYGEKIGINNNFVIYDELDVKKVIDKLIDEFVGKSDTRINTAFVRAEISKAKDNLITPEEFDSNIKQTEQVKQIVSSIYAAYRNKMKASQALDFDDIIMYTVKLLTDFQDVRDYYQEKFRYVLIDEFQDTNYAQFELARLLSGGYNNLMVVGDDDQSIYKFRGATIENILHFDDKIPDAKIVKLEENYRSTGNILTAANSIISHNFGRRGKELWTNAGDGDKLYVRQVEDQIDEGRYLQNTILNNVLKNKKRYNDFAILYRTNAQSRALEEVFVKSGLPYRVVGGHKFYERKEIKDIIAYLSVISNPDDNFHLERIVNEPKRKIGDSTMDAVRLISEYENLSYFYVMQHADKYSTLQKSRSKFDVFVNLIAELKMKSVEISVSELIKELIDLSGYEAALAADDSEESQERIDNIQELISAAAEYEKKNENPSLEGYLENVSLISDIDNYDSGADAVVMMTIHSAKGLEFPIVFIPGMEERIFPSFLSMGNEEQIEEERRLAYVAVTRAKEKCYITFAKSRMLYGKTEYAEMSRFIKEIDEKTVTIDADFTKPKMRMNPVSQVRYQPRNISSEFEKNSNISARNKTSMNLSVGDRVKHMIFGEGVIVSTKELGADTLYEINFDKVGMKKLMATFAKLEKL